MRCRTDKTTAKPTSVEALLREWLEAVSGDIEAAAPSDAVQERPSDGYAASAPVCHVVAGANGSGKTTFALHFLPRYAACLEFVNPNMIAGGLSPFDPARSAVKAGRLVLERVKEYAALADKLRVFDNSGPAPILVYEKNGDAVIHDAQRFEQLNREVGL